MKITILISLLFCLYACGGVQKKERKYFTLQVSLDGNTSKYLDDPLLKNEQRPVMQYDSLQVIAKYDSIRNGKKSVFIFSLLTPDIDKIIDLQSDSLLSLTPALYKTFTKGNADSLLSLLDGDADTIYIGQRLSGCFGGYYEKIVIYRDGDVNQVNYRRNLDSSLTFNGNLTDSSFNPYFKAFLNKCARDSKSGMYNFSTNHFYTYLRKRNTVYELPVFGEWAGYNDFKKQLNIKTD